MITSKQWDSDFFGYPVGVLASNSATDPASLRRQLLQSAFTLVYAFVSPDDEQSNTHMLEAGGRLADTKLVYAKTNLAQACTSGLALQDVCGRVDYQYKLLLQLALQSGQHSRFRTDPHFVKQEYHRLYTAWLDRSLDRTIADHVWAYSVGTEIAGFITDKRKEDYVEIGLLAVNPAFRGTGIGSALIRRVESLAAAAGLSSVEVATQKQNQQACRFYEYNGYQIKEAQNIYHFWQSA
ncbi:GNAT family N-acetyltransferase [Cesiribacter andamanensis]|uniref:TDP-fucosamine acetyltransferase n=1 Tax=Cesiribacter andamanensis AMV16 TaxID=1279009 RepID=M7NAK2_9BACT|nr:GNAT family N-acetyltransferase [Cesiribacter andamanensis]EMR04267.1 TDP-fucosamine acetyltransferase [Cesiribacter andamanensis AMV16]